MFAMQDSIMLLDGEDEVIKNTSSNARPHSKKKSTLTRLKERKQKELSSTTSLRKDELGSVTSLNKENNDFSIKETPQRILDDPKTVTQLHVNGEMQRIDLDTYNVSTKDPSEAIVHSRRPRPRPRGRKQSSDASAENFNNKNESISETTDPKDIYNGQYDNSDGTTIQMFRNIKMGSDHVDSVETSISQSSFVPKPPSTPRTPRSNPRTPRSLVLVGKEEKQIREPWSSGDEPEVGEKKEKSNKNSQHIMGTGEIVDISNFGSVSDLLSTNNVVNATAVKSSTSHELSGQSVHRERLRRSSRDTDSDSGSQGNSRERKYPSNLGKPPIKQSLIRIDSLNTDIKNSKKLLNSSAVKVDKSPLKVSSGDKSPKSSSSPRSKSPTSHLSQKSASSMSEYGMPLEKLSPVSRLSHASPTDGNIDGASKDERTDNIVSHLSDHLLTDSKIGSQSTQAVQTSDSPVKMQPVSSPPRTSRLDPISPRSYPPPLKEEFCSSSLRTMYKIDPDIHQRAGMGHLEVNMDKSSDSGANSNVDRLSQRSFTSVSVLPVITTKEARSRNLQEGSIMGMSPSTLGTDELDRYFPERRVNIFVGTWNMNELKDVTKSLDDFILPEKCDYVQDIYAIGTQENNVNKKEWEIKIQETLGPSHVLFHSACLGSLHLAVYIRRDLIWFCSVPEDETISLRAVTMVKTKGAIGICFNLFGTSFLFINCHLTSDRDNEISRKKNRLGDYYKVISAMKLPKLTEQISTKEKPEFGHSKHEADITAVFDCIFWFGDLNFRLERKRQAVERKVNQIVSEEYPNFETLLGSDQLQNYMAEGKIFGGFQEGRINFHPTFKFDLDTDTYDSSAKNRVPSYTDRVIFRSKKKHNITCVQYDAVMGIRTSDHRPVYGLYEVAINPARDNMVYSVGHFDKYVYMEAIRRRTVARPVKKKQSVVCTIQ